MTTQQLLLVCGSLQRRSANRAALEVAERHAVECYVTEPQSSDQESVPAVDVRWFDHLSEIPPLNPDTMDPAPSAVEAWRSLIAESSAILIASPEYAGSLAGTLKNALDWIVGTGELYRKPVAIVSSGSSGGPHARHQLLQTLTWQGAYTIGQLGIRAPMTKSDSSGVFTDPTTLTAIQDLTDQLLAAAALPATDCAALAEATVAAAGIEPGHIPPA